MSEQLQLRRHPHLHRLFSTETLSGLEVLVLAPLALWLVFDVIPSAFEVEWGCLAQTGVARTSGEDYVATFAVVGALGWLAVIGATVLANASGWRRAAILVPAIWFGLLVVVAIVVAASIGPQPC